MPEVYWTKSLSCLHPLNNQMGNTLRFERIQLYHACTYTCFASNWQLNNGNLESAYDQMDVTIQVIAVGELYVFHAFVRLSHACTHMHCTSEQIQCSLSLCHSLTLCLLWILVGPSSSISSTSATTTTVVSSTLPNRYSSACMDSDKHMQKCAGRCVRLATTYVLATQKQDTLGVKCYVQYFL